MAAQVGSTVDQFDCDEQLGMGWGYEQDVLYVFLCMLGHGHMGSSTVCKSLQTQPRLLYCDLMN